MEQLPLLLNLAVATLWLGVFVDLIRRPPNLPSGWNKALRRTLWGLASVLALLSGGWGAQLWQSTTTASPRNPDAGQPVAASSSMVRTPFAIVERTVSLDGEGRTIQNRRTTTLQIPLALLAFLAGAGWLQWRRRSAPAAVTALLASMLLTGCGGDGSVLSNRDRPERQLVEVRWDTLVHIRSELEDSLLFSVSSPRADEHGFWILDFYGSRLARFDWNGQLVRYVGRHGGGPGEFAAARRIDTDDQGTVWVLDLDNNRITGFDTEGRIVDEIRLGGFDWRPDAFAVTGDGQSFLLVETLQELAPIVIDRSGRVTRGEFIPVPDAGGAWGMGLNGHVTRNRGGDGWVYAFGSGDGFYRLSGVEMVGPRVRYPEPIPFPTVMRTSTTEGAVTSTTTWLTNRKASATSISAHDGELLIVFAGESEHANLLLERYDLESGRYLDSALLPRRGSITQWGDRLVLAANNPTPEVLVLRRVD
jgi:hypothetical protein